MEKEYSFQKMMLGQLDSHLQNENKRKFTPISYHIQNLIQNGKVKAIKLLEEGISVNKALWFWIKQWYFRYGTQIQTAK